MVVVLWQNWSEHLTHQLPHFLTTTTLTDVTISVGEASLKAHRIVLAFFSPFFKRMLEDVSEERPMVVVFPGINFAALKLIVAYMYHGTVNVPIELLRPVGDLANMLKIKGLTDLPIELGSAIEGPMKEIEANNLSSMDTEDKQIMECTISDSDEEVCVVPQDKKSHSLLPSHQGVQLCTASDLFTPIHIVKTTTASIPSTTITTSVTATTSTTTSATTSATITPVDDSQDGPAKKKRKYVHIPPPCRSNMSVEEYKEASKAKFAFDNILYEKVIHFLKNGKHPTGLTCNERSCLKRKSLKFHWDPEEKILYYTGSRDPKRRKLKVVRSLEEQTSIIKSNHNNATSSGHVGMRTTLEKIAQKYYWRSMTLDIKHYVDSCSKCRAYLLETQLTPEAPQECTEDPLKVIEPWDFFGLDIEIVETNLDGLTSTLLSDSSNSSIQIVEQEQEQQ